jgi:hypothetical protein
MEKKQTNKRDHYNRDITSYWIAQGLINTFTPFLTEEQMMHR